MFSQQLHEKELSLFAPTIQIISKYQIKDFKKNLMKHMTMFFGAIFNQNLVETMVGKYMKSLRENYCTNISRYLGYDHPIIILEWEWDTMLEYFEEKNMRK